MSVSLSISGSRSEITWRLLLGYDVTGFLCFTVFSGFVCLVLVAASGVLQVPAAAVGRVRDDQVVLLGRRFQAGPGAGHGRR